MTVVTTRVRAIWHVHSIGSGNGGNPRLDDGSCCLPWAAR